MPNQIQNPNIKLAVIKTGGKQYLVSPGQKLRIEKIPNQAGESVIFDQVLLISDGQETKVGQPLVKGAQAKAKVLSQGKAKKITILKFKPKVRYRKKMGHRQPYTEIEIASIES
jgi:large subunit ribosomal protein L21